MLGKSNLSQAAVFLIAHLFLVGCQAEQRTPDEGTVSLAGACEGLPRNENAALPLSDVSDDWFQVYETSEGVYSIVEPYQYEESISHLIVGDERAILFDTGIGLRPIRRRKYNLKGGRRETPARDNFQTGVRTITRY